MEVCSDAAVKVVNTASGGTFSSWWGHQHLKERDCSKVSGDDRRDAVDEQRGAQVLGQQLQLV